MHHCYLEDREYAGVISIGSEKGKLVANDSGKATLFALESLSARGTLFVAPGDMVRTGPMYLFSPRARNYNNFSFLT
jgi:GTP-binding protein